MKALLLHLHLLEPVLATRAVTEEENSSISQEYIPGSALRGAAIQAYLSQSQNGAATKDEIDLLEEKEAHRLFFQGGLVFLNAYPARPGDGKRALPCPLSWLRLKDQEKPVYDFAVRDPQIRKPFKSPDDRFFWQEDGAFSTYTPEMQVVVHNASLDRNAKRVGDSTVYRYDAIATGEALVGGVLGDEKDLAELVQWLQGFPLVLGGSHTAGYGRVGLTIEGPVEWSESTAHAEFTTSKDNEPLVAITLLSDAVLRTADGQVSCDFDRALGEAAGLKLPLKNQAAFQQVALAGGFNRKWGLPLAQEWVIKAGSTFVYRRADLDMSRLHGLVAQGMGERRNEGFGRLALNLTHIALPQVDRLYIDQRQPAPEARLSEESRELARLMSERRLCSILDRRLIQAINGFEMKSPIPEKTQLSRLRVVAQRARIQRNLSMITEYLANLKPPSKRQFERCKVSENGQVKRLLPWIEGKVKTQDVFELLGVDIKLLDYTVAGVKATPDADLRIGYMTRLLDGVLRKAAKQQPRKPAGAGEEVKP